MGVTGCPEFAHSLAATRVKPPAGSEVVPARRRPRPCGAEGRITQGWGSRILAQGC